MFKNAYRTHGVAGILFRRPVSDGPNQNDDPGSNPSFRTHQSQLTQVWKDIHDGHEQLVELEASTIVKVEAQLTEVQLKKLETMQSQASITPKSQNDDARR